MKYLLICLKTLEFIAFIAMIVIIILVPKVAVAVPSFAVWAILFMARLIVFFAYTNKYHRINEDATIKFTESVKGKFHAIYAEAKNDDFVVTINGTAVVLKLNGYMFKKSFVRALLTRLVYYREFKGTKIKASKFFNKPRLQKTYKNENCKIVFTENLKTKESLLVKNGKIKFGIICEQILISNRGYYVFRCGFPVREFNEYVRVDENWYQLTNLQDYFHLKRKEKSDKAIAKKRNRNRNS